MTYLKRGELAKAADTGIETIRYYERAGLIPEAERNDKGYRLFPPDTVKAIRFIRSCQNLGFTLKEITLLQNLKIEPDQQCGHVKESVDVKIKELDKKIRALTMMRRALAAMSGMCIPETSNRSCHFLELLEEDIS